MKSRMQRSVARSEATSVSSCAHCSRVAPVALVATAPRPARPIRAMNVLPHVDTVKTDAYAVPPHGATVPGAPPATPGAPGTWRTPALDTLMPMEQPPQSSQWRTPTVEDAVQGRLRSWTQTQLHEPDAESVEVAKARLQSGGWACGVCAHLDTDAEGLPEPRGTCPPCNAD